jgi:hypothetical protein
MRADDEDAGRWSCSLAVRRNPAGFRNRRTRYGLRVLQNLYPALGQPGESHRIVDKGPDGTDPDSGVLCGHARVIPMARLTPIQKPRISARQTLLPFRSAHFMVTTIYRFPNKAAIPKTHRTAKRGRKFHVLRAEIGYNEGVMTVESLADILEQELEGQWRLKT